MSLQEIDAIPGVGSGISGKIKELLETGNMKALDVYLNKTPPGILDMLAIRGFGPKKLNRYGKHLKLKPLENSSTHAMKTESPISKDSA